jgi:ATP synthase in type III secretion protein N
LKLIGNASKSENKMTNYGVKTQFENHLHKVKNAFEKTSLLLCFGAVKRISGTQVEAIIPSSRIGDLCEIESLQFNKPILAEVVGFNDKTSILATLNPPDGVAYNSKITPLRCKHKIKLSDSIYGSVFDGMGRQLGGEGLGILSKSLQLEKNEQFVIADAVAATEKPRISQPLLTGVKVIDGMLTLGEGQRVGLFAGAGCGKTTLLASLARGCKADAIVFALVGERGRELKEFLDHELDDELKARSILVCATSDRSSMERSRAAFTATAIAEALRDQGKKVLLLVDSLTRFARAQREIGLASGEPPAKGGFPPSVYAMLPRLIERAGKTNKGSITAIYTILLEGDSMADPVADEAKSLLDGHIVMNRKLAEKGHYPAIDVLKSLSRTMTNVVDVSHTQKANQVRALLSRYQDMELLIRLGEYSSGSDVFTDRAIQLNDQINIFLQQGTRETYEYEDIINMLGKFSH